MPVPVPVPVPDHSGLDVASCSSLDRPVLELGGHIASIIDASGMALGVTVSAIV